AMIPLHLALLRGAGIHRAATGAVDGGPRGVVLVDHLLSARPGPASRNLLTTFLGRVDGVLLHHREEAPLATRLGAARVYAAEQPEQVGSPARVGEAYRLRRIPVLTAVENAFGALPAEPPPPDLSA